MTVDVTSNQVKASKKRSQYMDILIRLFTKKPMGAFGAVIVVVMLLAGIFAEFIAPYPFEEIHPGDFLQPSSTEYILGTDNLGRD